MPRNSKKQPVQAASGQAYGMRSQQEAAQRAIPLPAAGPPAAPEMAAPMPQPPIPGQGGGFNRPSARPDEPLTTGLPIGAGAGPEALMSAGPDAEVAKEIESMRGYLPTLEYISATQDVSSTTRNFIRRLRGAQGGV